LYLNIVANTLRSSVTDLQVGCPEAKVAR